MKFRTTMALAIVLLTGLCGLAMADNPVNQTPETQGITTSTYVVCEGTVTQNTEMVWQQSSASLDSPPLTDTETQYTVSYSEQMIADNGYTEFTSQKELDTAAQVANQNNFESTDQIDFIPTSAGSYITFEEDLLVDGAGMPESTATSLLCPFGASTYDTIPAYCNIVEMGSSFDGTAVSMLTDVEERHVTATADPGVSMSYGVSLEGIGTATAYIKAHLMEGRGSALTKSLDSTYEEKTTASGVIGSFAKQMTYESGMRRF
ncbi:MAG: hypothetical protein LUQ01_01210 [Methanolinea sp.]|jgi:hypothetical protein|nr:hypothetical protein [Methanolinea sp.]